MADLVGQLNAELAAAAGSSQNFVRAMRINADQSCLVQPLKHLHHVAVDVE